MFPAHYDVAEAIAPTLQPSRRQDGWTAERQRNFCDAIAAGAPVGAAARAQGLSPSSAYAFRNSAAGAAFAVGWLAASLLQRQRLADEVTSRVFEGQTITVNRADGSTSERHYYDNRLAMSVLARLDRLAAGQLTAGVADTSGEGQAARIAAAEFDRYLDVLGEGGGPARAGLFLAARARDDAAPELAAISTLARADLYARTGAGVASEIAVADLDPNARADWTAEQWARAEAAGLLVVAPAPEAAPETLGDSPESQHSLEDLDDDRADNPVWQCEFTGEWRTRFPPPAGFDGHENGFFGREEYERALSDAEAAALGLPPAEDEDARELREADERDRWFAEAAVENDAIYVAPPVPAHLQPDASLPEQPAPAPAAAAPADAPGVVIYGDPSLPLGQDPACSFEAILAHINGPSAEHPGSAAEPEGDAPRSDRVAWRITA